MRTILRGVAGIVIVASLLTAPVLSAQEYVLPANPSTAVITLDYQGDRLRRIDDAPTLSIYANGNVVMPQNYAHSQAYQTQITGAELQQLLDFIIRQNQFFSYQAAKVNAKLSNLKRQPLPVHYSTTVISINADNRQQEVRLPALGKGPMVVETRRVLAIKQRLDKLMSFVKLGGTSEVASLLIIANHQLNLKLRNSKSLSIADRQALSASSFTADDLESGTRRPDGSINVRFKRSNGASVTIDIDAHGQQLVTVAADDQ